jgi:hypothetical protein
MNPRDGGGKVVKSISQIRRLGRDARLALPEALEG